MDCTSRKIQGFTVVPLPTLKEIKTLEEKSTRDVKFKKGDECVETCEDDEDDIYEFDSDYSEDDDC